MTIGNALFAQLTIARFNRVDEDIAAVQSRIAEGTNDPRASADPGRAAQLSAGREQQMRLAAFLSNADAAANRLSLTDSTLAAMSDVMRQVRQMALEAANTGTASTAREIHANQLNQYRSSLIALGNSRDSSGFPLFSGLSGTTPFSENAGTVRYAGDAGQVQVQVSESLRLPNGLSGDAALMNVPTANGHQSVFGMIDDLLASLTTLADTVATAGFMGTARLDLSSGAGAVATAFTLTGPAGSAAVVLPPAQDRPGGVVDAINARTAETGVSATLDPDSGAIVLAAAGQVTLSGLETDGGPAVLATLTPLQGDGTPLRLRAGHLDDGAILGRMAAAIDHLAERRGAVGAVAAEVDRQSTRLNTRKLTVDQAIAGLTDLDLAAASTRLAALMTQQQAAMQTYSMITRKTLFDFIG